MFETLEQKEMLAAIAKKQADTKASCAKCGHLWAVEVFNRAAVRQLSVVARRGSLLRLRLRVQRHLINSGLPVRTVAPRIPPLQSRLRLCELSTTIRRLDKASPRDNQRSLRRCNDRLSSRTPASSPEWSASHATSLHQRPGAVADTVRRSLAVPRSQEQEAEIRRLVADSLAQVNGILAEKRRDGSQSARAKSSGVRVPRKCRFRGRTLLRHGEHAPAGRHRDHARPHRVLGRGAWTAGAADWTTRTRTSLRDVHHHDQRRLIERYDHHHLRTEDLKRPSREAYAWLRFFADRTNFAAYVSAVRVAHPILRAAMSAIPRHQADLLVEFRPMTGLYRVRGYADTTRVALPTPMISFDEPLFRALAAAMFGNGIEAGRHGSRAERTVPGHAGGDWTRSKAWSSAPRACITISPSHLIAWHRSIWMVKLSRPRLTWNRTLTGRKFGHYDPLTDTVMISCTLDHADVPEFVVDFVMYHELLHKKLGVGWRNGRQEAHTPEFRREERRFAEYTRAEDALNAIAREHA
jgi:hypothetical protein